LIHPKKPVEPNEPKISYEEFKERVKRILEGVPEGLMWTEIRQRATFLKSFQITSGLGC